MAQFKQRISTIRVKVIIGVLFLILTIQLGSSGFQYFRTRSILMEEFVRGSQNLVEPLFTILKDQLGLLSGGKELELQRAEPFLKSYAEVLAYQQCESIVSDKADLSSIIFVGVKGNIIAETVKKNNQEYADEEQDQQEADEVKSMKTVDSALMKLIDGHELGVIERNDQFDVFVPFFLKELYLGGYVLSYSKERISDILSQIWLVSLGLILFYTVVSLSLVIVAANRMFARPIQKMISIMREVAKGDLDNEVAIKSNDEIAEIASALNDLISVLRLTFLKVSEAMQEMENGNLSKQIDTDFEGEFDHLKNSINQSIMMLGKTIIHVADTSEQVDIGSNELSRVSSEISSNTNVMASTLEQISSSMMEIENKTKENTDHSTNAQQISTSTLDLVNKGNDQMGNMMVSINKISETSTDVSKIIKAIDEIAFQTNLLALNAAVEAARAGKYGKGFAVVAEEVRNLAARSADAAKNTTSLIETSLKEVRLGVENAEKTGAILSEITVGVTESNQLMNEIAEASQRQSENISEVNVALSQINDIVQQNSAISEETASSSVELSNHASDLKKIISQFKLPEQEQKPLEQEQDARTRDDERRRIEGQATPLLGTGEVA